MIYTCSLTVSRTSPVTRLPSSANHSTELALTKVWNQTKAWAHQQHECKSWGLSWEREGVACNRRTLVQFCPCNPPLLARSPLPPFTPGRDLRSGLRQRLSTLHRHDDSNVLRVKNDEVVPSGGRGFKRVEGEGAADRQKTPRTESGPCSHAFTPPQDSAPLFRSQLAPLRGIAGKVCNVFVCIGVCKRRVLKARSKECINHNCQ